MDAATLSKAMGGALPLARYQALLPEMERAMRAAGVTTQLRAAHWLSQLGHECLGLSALTEFASGEAYNWRSDLGNTQPGDGPRFRGRGAIMITGRGHYSNLSKWAFSKGLVPTSTYFVDNPNALASEKYYCIGAEWYWTVARPQMNSLCDKDDLTGVTKAINGGTRGIEDRRTRLARCKALGAAILPSVSNSGGHVSTRKLDYYNVEPDATQLTNAFTAGRGGKRIQYVTLHHMAGNGNLASCVSLWNRNMNASAHYTVNSTGGVGQAVYDSNTAWSNGNSASNQVSISIEHANISGQVNGNDSDKNSWKISNATIIGGARLTAALCLYYNLGRPVWGKNVRAHREFRATFCPGHLSSGMQYNARYMAEAQSFYDKLVAKSVNADGTPKASATTPTTPKKKEETMTPEQEKMLREVHYQLLNKWPQLGNQTLVDAVARLSDQVYGYEKDEKGNYKYSGWPGIDGNGGKTLIEAVAEIQKAVVEKKEDK